MSYHKSSTSILSSLDKDYIEEGRGDIYKWGEKRSTRRRGIRGWAYAFKKRFIDKSVSAFYFYTHSRGTGRGVILFLLTSFPIKLINFKTIVGYLQILRSFLNNLTVSLLLQLILSGKFHFLVYTRMILMKCSRISNHLANKLLI